MTKRAAEYQATTGDQPSSASSVRAMLTPQKNNIQPVPSLIAAFQPDDLLYGLELVRLQYREQLKQKVGGKFICVDELISPIEGSFFSLEGEVTTREHPKFNDNYQALSKEHQAFFDFLLESVPDKKLRFEQPLTEQEKHRQKKLSVEERFRRRVCKAGMYYRKIHFCLDGIDLKQVYDRNYSLKMGPNDRGQYSYDSFTSAELRYLKNNWAELQDQVTFYLNGKRVNNTPWEMTQTQMAVTSTAQLLKKLNRPPPAPRRTGKKRTRFVLDDAATTNEINRSAASLFDRFVRSDEPEGLASAAAALDKQEKLLKDQHDIEPLPELKRYRRVETTKPIYASQRLFAGVADSDESTGLRQANNWLEQQDATTERETGPLTPPRFGKAP